MAKAPEQIVWDKLVQKLLEADSDGKPCARLYTAIRVLEEEFDLSWRFVSWDAYTVSFLKTWAAE